MVLRTLDNYMQSNEIGALSYTTCKNQLEMECVGNKRPEIVKLLEDNTVKKKLDTGHIDSSQMRVFQHYPINSHSL